MAQDKICENCGLLDSIVVRRHRIFSKNSPPVIRSLCKNCYYKITHGLNDSKPKKVQNIPILSGFKKFILAFYEFLFVFIGSFIQIIGRIIEGFGVVLFEMVEQWKLEISFEEIFTTQKLPNVFQSINETKECAICGEDDSRFLEKHHIDGRNFSSDSIFLCKNCHYKITYEQNKVTPKKRSKNAMRIYSVIFMLISEGVLFNEMGKELTCIGEALFKITNN